MASRKNIHLSDVNRKRDLKYPPSSMPKIVEQQIDAYLSAKDVIRRIQRTTPLVISAYAETPNGLRSSRD